MGKLPELVIDHVDPLDLMRRKEGGTGNDGEIDRGLGEGSLGLAEKGLDIVM